MSFCVMFFSIMREVGRREAASYFFCVVWLKFVMGAFEAPFFVGEGDGFFREISIAVWVYER